MSDTKITQIDKINFNGINIDFTRTETQRKFNNSLWENAGFEKDSFIKGLFVEKAPTPFSKIANTPVNKKELADFVENINVETQWRDDFSSAVKTQNDLAVLKELALLKNKNGERLYDSFQIFQFTGENGAKKLELAKRFLKENPEYTYNNYNMPLINYIVKNNCSEDEIKAIIKNAK